MTFAPTREAAAVMASKRSSSRNELTLKERYKVIEYSKKHPRDSTRAIAEVFNCGRTQIQQILKNKDRIVLEFEAKGEPATRKRKRKAEFQSVNDAVYQWYRLVRQRNVRAYATNRSSINSR